MTTPQDVVQAAADVLRGSRLERARAGMTALNLFGQLSTDDKRDLAVLVAQRAAPQLVPRIEAESGMDMTPEQSRAVLDMVRRLDGDDLAEIQAALGSPDGRRAAMAAVGTAAATATGIDDVVAAPDGGSNAEGTGDGDAPASVRAPVDDATTEQDRARIRVLEDQVDQLTEQLAGARRDTSEAESRARTAEGELQSASARATEAEERTDDLTRALDDARSATRAAEERLRKADAEARRAALRTSPGTPHRPLSDTRSAPGSVATSTTGSATGLDAADLARRMQAVSTSAALRMLVGAAPGLAGATAHDRLHLVRSLPDGWARRKAIQRLVETGVVTPGEAPTMVAQLDSTGNQVFAASTMLEAGLVELDALVDDLSASALARLARRVPLVRTAG